MMTKKDRLELLHAMLKDLGVKPGDKLAILRPRSMGDSRALFEFTPVGNEDYFQPWAAQLRWIDLPQP